ncbi:cysteine--tRNA ligase [Bacteriovorax sp. BSW11_IV]|uniref:cysteine--tRNA ligase n=1 Tax=Bacteriovorax sp. BSW11_IV TaxID=1353529 RepID=UPI00038A4DB9|nr:cysteine--tRNA ligase [Bacteriovorax sp. BSW11_IV]EQC49900.1 cysteine--tRNA ligase [Bacteriovorax sp. BSW11_IV]
MTLTVFNTMTKEKESFKSIEPGKVKMYVCGPTVYDYLHIGNFRGAIFFNMVRNWLEHSGYDVTFVYNYTDVDDKIIARANERGITSNELSEEFIRAFEEDFSRLGLRKHDHNPKVTDYMDQIIEYVASLVEQKKAYVVNGEVFYSIDSFKPYGALSGKKLDDLHAGQRVEVDPNKLSPFDFVLWKPAKEGEPSWASPWGQGRPGWHIECSAMIKSLLGDTIDIHGGGIDLIFPHHENEIAQGEGCTGCKYVNYWMHNDFINIKGEKMSKSLGNFITARGFMDTYHPEVLKFLMLSAHYRSLLNVSDEKIEQTFSGLARVYHALNSANQMLLKTEAVAGAATEKNFDSMLKELDKKIEKSMNDDFSTNEVIACIYEAVRGFNALNLGKKLKDPATHVTVKRFKEWVLQYGSMMALFVEEPSQFLREVDDILLKQKGLSRNEVDALIEERANARLEKDFAKSDEIRDKLHNMGIDFQDTPEGPIWNVKI